MLFACMLISPCTQIPAAWAVCVLNSARPVRLYSSQSCWEDVLEIIPNGSVALLNAFGLCLFLSEGRYYAASHPSVNRVSLEDCLFHA